MNIFGKLLFVLIFAFASAAGAQQGKIGIIDLRKVFEEYHKTKTADARLKDHQVELERERKVMIDQFQKATDDYKVALEGASDQAVSADEREKRKKTAESKLLDIKKLEGDIGQFDRQARSTLIEEERKVRDRILAEIREVITAKAKAAGYAMVVDSAAETINKTPVVMYTNGENDLTAAVLAQLNANAPTAATSPGAGAAASGASGPK